MEIQPQKPHLYGNRILVVEDEFFIADDLCNAISMAGGTIIGPASRLPDAENLLSNSTVDFAILDINLFGHMIFNLADTLKKRNVTLIFATGYDRHSLPARFADTPCWQKPYDVDEIVRWIETAILSADQ